MRPTLLAAASHPPTDAVVQVSDHRTARLYLGHDPVKHADGVNPNTIMHILLDYASTLDEPLTVTTQLPGGVWTRHQIDQTGRLTRIPASRPAKASSASESEPRRHPEQSKRQGPLIRRLHCRAPAVVSITVVGFVLALVVLTF